MPTMKIGRLERLPSRASRVSRLALNVASIALKRVRAVLTS
jgi:hypothetical protein